MLGGSTAPDGTASFVTISDTTGGTASLVEDLRRDRQRCISPFRLQEAIARRFVPEILCCWDPVDQLPIMLRCSCDRRLIDGPCFRDNLVDDCGDTVLFGRRQIAGCELIDILLPVPGQHRGQLLKLGIALDQAAPGLLVVGRRCQGLRIEEPSAPELVRFADRPQPALAGLPGLRAEAYREPCRPRPGSAPAFAFSRRPATISGRPPSTENRVRPRRPRRTATILRSVESSQQSAQLAFPLRRIWRSPPRSGMANTHPVRIIVDLDGKISSLIAG